MKATTPTTVQTTKPRAYSHVESLIIAGLGGSPWMPSDRANADLPLAKQIWSHSRVAVGFQPSTTGWVTTDKTNVKLSKAGLPTVGVTLHAARAGLAAWRSADATVKANLALALGVTTDTCDAALRRTVCPSATRGCVAGCVVAHSANGEMQRTQLSRLARTLITLVRPEVALALTADALDHLVDIHGVEGSRWRVNISDDIRWEIVAPGLFVHAPKAYAYTKWFPAQRPSAAGMAIVYSASERWTREDIVEVCNGGERVAVVFDCRKGGLPTSWGGVPVVDGDKTDDLFAHPKGAIVGLAVKGPTLAVRSQMTTAGFTFPVGFTQARRRQLALTVAA